VILAVVLTGARSEDDSAAVFAGIARLQQVRSKAQLDLIYYAVHLDNPRMKSVTENGRLAVLFLGV
jgi:hypothetical protein